MRRVFLAVAVMFFSALAFIGIAQPAQAANNQNCQEITSTLINRVTVCVQVGYENVNSTTKTLKYINVSCSPAINFSDGVAIDGINLDVTNASGAIIWSTPDSNADVPKSTCNRTWAIGNNYKTQSFGGHIYGKARLYKATDVAFNLRVYT